MPVTLREDRPSVCVCSVRRLLFHFPKWFLSLTRLHLNEMTACFMQAAATWRWHWPFSSGSSSESPSSVVYQCIDIPKVAISWRSLYITSAISQVTQGAHGWLLAAVVREQRDMIEESRRREETEALRVTLGEDECDGVGRWNGCAECVFSAIQFKSSLANLDLRATDKQKRLF